MEGASHADEQLHTVMLAQRAQQDGTTTGGQQHSDANTNGPVVQPDGASEPAKSTPSSSWTSIIAGPVAGVCSRFFIYPSDTIKARLQVQGSLTSAGGPVYHGMWDAAGKIASKEGLRGFYKGFSAVVVGNIPANAAYFSGYELGKSLIPEEWGLGGQLLVGACAQLSGGLLFTPVDIVKERMQVQGMMVGSAGRYTSSWHALRHLVSQQGVLGLFRGYWATNAVWIPWSMIHISLYEQFKKSFIGWHVTTSTASHVSPSPAPQLPSDDASSAEDALPAWLLGSCSAVSASVASVLTHPADVIKTRLQVLSGSTPGTTAWQLAVDALRKEGPKVFLAGASARVLTLAPGSALSWMVYEPVKTFLDGL